MQPEISKKKSKSHQEQEIKKALVSRKLQENQRKYVQKEIKKKTKKQKKEAKWKTERGWGWRTIKKFKKCNINENQRKSMGK